MSLRCVTLLNRYRLLKSILSIALIFGLLGSSINKLIICTNYLLNQDVISKTFCENRSKPKLKCKGKCHLSKQLNEEEERDFPNKKILKEINDIQLYDGMQNIQLAVPFRQFVIVVYFYWQRNLSEMVSQIFHPPTQL